MHETCRDPPGRIRTFNGGKQQIFKGLAEIPYAQLSAPACAKSHITGLCMKQGNLRTFPFDEGYVTAVSAHSLHYMHRRRTFYRG